MEINETQEKMLTERGVIVLPADISHETYQNLLALLMLAETMWADKPIRLFCAGYGGDAVAAMAIADLVQANERVVGILAGVAESSHVTIFAACPKRYVYPHAQIGIHRISYAQISSRQDAQSVQNRVEHLQQLEGEVAKILADASCHDASWWLEQIIAIGSDACDYFHSQWILANEMALPISEYGDGKMFTKNIGGGSVSPRTYYEPGVPESL